MKRNLCILLLLSLLVGVAAAETSSAEQIAVTSVALDPGTLMRGDTGTVTVEIQNTGDSGVAISRAELYSRGVVVVNDRTYDSVGTLGPGNTISFTFTVRADTEDGIYYPLFYLDLRDGGSVRYSIPVTIESTAIQVNVIDAPETFPATVRTPSSSRSGTPAEPV